MRALACLALLLFAGCTAPTEPTPALVGTSPATAPASHDFNLDGQLWLPMTLSANMSQTIQPFAVNGSVVNTTFTFQLRSTLPINAVVAAMAMIDVKDDAGRILGQAMLMAPGPYDQTVNLPRLDAGNYTIVFNTRGGSDGGSSGDFIKFSGHGAPA